MGIYWSNMFTICKINLSFLNIVTLNCVLSDPLGGIWLILFEVNTYHAFMHTLLKTLYIPVPLAHPVWSEHIPYIHAHPIKDITYHEPTGTGQVLHDHRGKHNTWRTTKVNITNRLSRNHRGKTAKKAST